MRIIRTSEPACNVVFRPLVRRLGKDLFRLVELNHFTQQEKSCEFGHARRLLHIMGHNYDGIPFFELKDQLFNLSRRNGSRAEQGSSISSTSGCTARLRAMHSRCCWPPDRLAAGFVQVILHFFPETGADE